MDFWRMVVEHNVATMVVLSSEGEFWQYWPLDQGDKVGFSPPPPPNPLKKEKKIETALFLLPLEFSSYGENYYLPFLYFSFASLFVTD